MIASTNLVGVGVNVVLGKSEDKPYEVGLTIQGGAASIIGGITPDFARMLARTLTLKAEHAELLMEENEK